MKRSESFLVYGVTGILVVILAVAVIFGDGEARAGERSEASDALVLIDLDDLIDEELGASLAGADPAEPTASVPAEGAAREGEVVAPDGASTAEFPLNARPAAGMDSQLAIVLGASERVPQPNGNAYRVVTTRPGDTWDALVIKWCGSRARADEVRALNETVDRERLPVGIKLHLPWVDDAELLAAHEARGAAQLEDQRFAARDTAREASFTRTAAPTGASKQYVVKAGDSMWKIAARIVGDKRAKAYVDEITQLNGLSDPSRIRVGQTLTLPAAP